MAKLQWLDGNRLEVTLDNDEAKEAARASFERYRSQRAANRKDTKVSIEDGQMLDWQGAVAELAVSLAFRLPWDGRFKPIKEWDLWRHQEGHDVSGIEVKSIRPDGYSLILHPESKAEFPAVLVQVLGKYKAVLIGWIYTHEGQKPEFWRDNVPEPCYMVKQDRLRPIPELLDTLGVKYDKPDAPKPPAEITADELEALLIVKDD